jgi:hypothetical protein
VLSWRSARIAQTAPAVQIQSGQRWISSPRRANSAMTGDPAPLSPRYNRPVEIKQGDRAA